MKNWDYESARRLCRAIEEVCPRFGCHVALTGGCLYKEGSRKDCDILFYRIRQVEAIDTAGLFSALAELGISIVSGFGWCYKAKCLILGDVDIFFPEEQKGTYVREEQDGGLFENSEKGG